MRIFARTAVVILCWGVSNAALAYPPIVNYQLQCMGCHLADGSGQPGRVPSVRRSLALLSATPEGRDFVIRVPGVAQSSLSSEETAELLNWMLKNLSDLQVPSEVAAYSADEVQRLRGHPLVQVKSLRARLLRSASQKPPSP